jgi:hypothetical protein
MPFTLLKPDGIDLSQTFDFTGTVSGAGGGKVLQAVHSKAYTGQSSLTTGVVEYTGGNISITPAATSSKILVMINGTMMVGRNGQSQTHGNGRAELYRDSTDLDIQCEVGQNYGSISNGNQWADHGITFNVTGLDSPNTTSSVTYKLYFKGAGNLQGYVPMGGKVTFTAIEIAA